MLIKDAEGNDIEVMSQEEVEAKLASEKTAWKAESDAKIAEAQTAVETALADKTRLEAELAAAGGNDDTKNFATVKAALTKKDEEISNLRKVVQESSNLRLKDIETDILSTVSRGDKEFEKKVRLHYDTTLAAVKAESKEDIARKMESAVKLAGGFNNGVDVIGQANFSGGGMGMGAGAPVGPGVELTAGQKVLAGKLGITPEDIKKYGPKIK